MDKIFLVIIILFFSCSSDQEKAKALIQKKATITEESTEDKRQQKKSNPPEHSKKVKETLIDNLKNKKNNCRCYNGIGASEKDKPILVYKFSNGKSISVCGYHRQDIKLDGLIMSEFNIFDCQKGVSVLEFGALQTCKIVEEDNSIKIIELKFLPAGPNWNWELIPIGEQSIIIKDEDIFANDPKPNFKSPIIAETLQNDFLKTLKKDNGFGENWEEDLGRLEVLSLLGNEKSWSILKNYEEFTAQKTDGAIAEQWADAVATVKWVKKIK